MEQKLWECVSNVGDDYVEVIASPHPDNWVPAPHGPDPTGKKKCPVLREIIQQHVPRLQMFKTTQYNISI